MASSYLLF